MSYVLKENLGIDVKGWRDKLIYILYHGKKMTVKWNLPKPEVILKLQVDPEAYKEVCELILAEASKNPLSEEEVEGFWK